MSLRQVDRLRINYRNYGEKGFIHKNKGKIPVNKLNRNLIDKLENFGNSMGWCDEGDYKEIVFEHERILMDDCDENGNQLECFIVTMTPPTELYFL